MTNELTFDVANLNVLCQIVGLTKAALMDWGIDADKAYDDKALEFTKTLIKKRFVFVCRTEGLVVAYTAFIDSSMKKDRPE